MRRINYEEYENLRKLYIKNKAILGTEKVSSSRPRDRGEREILARFDMRRWSNWLKDGTLKQLGPRKYRMTV